MPLTSSSAKPIVLGLERRGVAARARDDSGACADRREGSHDGWASRCDHQIGRIVNGHPMPAWPARPPISVLRSLKWHGAGAEWPRASMPTRRRAPIAKEIRTR
ncbi:hypothetical protein T492DRAFT_1035656, partial [Pavlovales sp. CCMP2436]